METAEHQEWRARQAFSPGAAFKAAFGAGLIFYYMSGGSPWSTAGTMNMIMGRDIPVPGGPYTSFFTILIAHFAVAYHLHVHHRRTRSTGCTPPSRCRRGS